MTCSVCGDQKEIKSHAVSAYSAVEVLVCPTCLSVDALPELVRDEVLSYRKEKRKAAQK
jgi:hypothetical protein